MSVKIRLQRHGRKQAPYYHIVVADARAPRDGKFIELIGSYKPQTVPATIELNNAKAIKWLENGAQPTDTVRAILSYKGVLLQRHLDAGIRKGALTQEQADAKLAAWIEDKAGKVNAKKEGLTKAQQDAKAKALKAEKVANEKRVNAAAEALKAAEVTEEVEEVVAEETPVEEVAEVVVEETPVAEAATEEVAEVVVEEAPVAEATTEEAPAAEENNEATEA